MADKSQAGVPRITRRAVTLGLWPRAAALAGVLAAACAPTSGPASEPIPAARPVTLRWWSYFNPQDRGRMFEPVASEYRAKHPNVQFEMNHGGADYSAKLATSLAAGDPPELLGQAHLIILDLARQGLLLDLANWYGQANRNKVVHPAAQDWASVDGKLIGFPGHDCFAQGWYYNAGVFEELRLAEPKSTEALIEACGRLRGRGLAHPLMLSDNNTRVGLMCAIQAQTAGIKPIEAAIARKDFNVPGLVEAFDLYVALAQRAAVSAETVGLAGGTIPAFANGQGGILPVHTGSYPAVKVAADASGFVRLGLFKQAISFTARPASRWSAGWGMIWSVPKATRLAAETLDFLGYWAEPSVQRRVAANGDGIPPLPETWGAITDPLLRITVGHLGEATRESLFMQGFFPTQLLQPWRDGLVALALRQISVKEMIESMNAAVRAS